MAIVTGARGWAWALAVALALVGFAWRVVPARSVVLPAAAAPRLLGTDAYDHLRRAAQLAGTLPADLTPLPAHADDRVEPGLFDAALALPAILASGSPPTLDALRRAGIWLPPVLGALSIVLLFALARQTLPAADAALVALLYLLYPAESLDRTTLGFGDHHAAEVVLTLLAAVALGRLLGDARERPWWRPALAPALPVVALLHVWRGAAVTLLLLALGLVAVGLAEWASGGDGGPTARRAGRYALGVAAGMAAVRLGLPGWQLGPVTMARAWLAVAALLAVGPLLATIARPTRSGPGRLGAAWRLGGLAAVGAAILATDAGRRLLAAGGPRTPLVQEHVAVEAATAFAALGPVAVLALPGGLVLLVACRRRRLPATGLIPALLAAGTAALWWRTRDVGYLPPPFLAFAAGGALWALRGWLTRGAAAAGPAAARRAAALSLVPALAVAVAPAWPYAITDSPATSRERVESLLVYDDGAVAAVSWLRRNTPPAGRYFVATPWVLGNLVATDGERRPLWSRMPTAAAGSWLLSRGEDESLAALAAAARGGAVSYAVIDGRSCGSYFVSEARSTGVEPELVAVGQLAVAGRTLTRWEFGAAYRESLAARLCFGDGEPWRRYRLLWESPQRLVTVHSLAVPPAADGETRVRLISLDADDAGAARDPGAAIQLANGEVLYGGREHAAYRVFAVDPGG